MRPRKLTPQAREALTRRQAALTALSSHPSWASFEEEIALKEERIHKAVLARTLGAAPSDPINEVDIYYWRGFIQGMRYLLAVPTGAENKLEQFLRSQGVQLEGVSVE
jgi:hypothetical protein